MLKKVCLNLKLEGKKSTLIAWQENIWKFIKIFVLRVKVSVEEKSFISLENKKAKKYVGYCFR